METSSSSSFSSFSFFFASLSLRKKSIARFLVVSSNDLNYNLRRDVSLPDRYKISKRRT